MKIDFCPNKRRLILLSCPLQLISIDSRSPSGLRQAKRHRGLPDASFQFTQPKRAATSCWSSNVFRRNVSIHAAQAGCDQVRRAYHPTKRAFQFTQPKRAATGEYLTAALSFTVSIHAAQAGCDGAVGVSETKASVSIHAAQAGCDSWTEF